MARLPPPEERLASVIDDIPFPLDEPGQPCINDHIFKFARACWKAAIPVGMGIDACYSLITRNLKSPHEITRQFERAYSVTIDFSDYKSAPKIDPYNPELLCRYAERVPFEATDRWLSEISPDYVEDNQTERFLEAIYRPGETVWVGETDSSRGYLITPHANGNLKGLPNCEKFLVNPVCGKVIDGSVRREANLTSFRHLLIESDQAPRQEWLRMIVQIHAPIVALYESGRRSIHCIVRVNAANKAEFDEIASEYRKQLVPLGMDKNSGRAVQLSRLPGALRLETKRTQKLLYLNSEPTGDPIISDAQNGIWQEERIGCQPSGI